MRTASELSFFRHRRSNALGRKIELVTLALLVMTFIGVATDRLWMLRIAAEETSVTHFEGAIRSALGLTVAQFIAQGRDRDLIALDGMNPVALLDP